MLTVPQLAARTVVPVGAAMSSPLWMWSPRLSPYGLVTVPPETGETIRPSDVQPPLPVETGVDDGAVDGAGDEGAEPEGPDEGAEPEGPDDGADGAGADDD